MDDAGCIDVIFLDFLKAFDTVPHQRLLKKLEAYGVSGSILLWIRNFLHERKMRVCIGESHSELVDVTSGVPQGSVLGPLIFLLYVNDIPNIVSSFISLFADDTKLWRNVICMADHEWLQQDLNKLCDWSHNWLLKFNVDKCCVMYHGP